MKRPNILWLTTDQQRSDTIHALGNPDIDTPNLDRLCARGVAFTRNYCQNPICTPSRSSFMTGRYPSAVNANINGADNLPEHCTLISRRLADAGYTCGLLGKLHITSAWEYEPRMDDGFTYFETMLGSGHYLRQEGNPYRKWLEDKGVDWRDLFTTDEKHDYHWYRPDAPAEYRQTAYLAERAVQFMAKHKDDEAPWMLCVNCYDPHPPYDGPQALTDKYMARNLADPIYSEKDITLDKKLGNFFFQSSATPMDDRLRRNKANYYGMVETIDAHYGKILDALDELGLTENTLVIYNSDHGEMLGDHGLTHKGCRFYEGLVHVPLIMSLPGRLARGVRYDGMTELTDIVPTIADLCGLTIPEDELAGHSLLPVLEGKEYTPRKFVRTEYYDTLEEDPTYDGLRAEGQTEYTDEKGKGSYAEMYLDGRYKLCVYHGQDFGELYDLESDPREEHNLWEEKDYQQIKTGLLLQAFNASVRFSRPGQHRRGRY